MAGSADRERITAVPAATPAAAGQSTAYVRHPGDVIRVALGSPGRAARLFGGSAVVTLGYTCAFAGATLIVIPHTAGLGAALVYLAALPVASLLPVPGGVVVLDALLVAGELLDGAGIVPAIVAVLLFRPLTYWLVLVPGFFAYRQLTVLLPDPAPWGS